MTFEGKWGADEFRDYILGLIDLLRKYSFI